MRASCHPWTCTYTEQHRRGAWTFYLILIFFGVATFTYICAPLPGCNTVFGAGRMRPWIVWFWAALMPVWLISFVTLVQGVNYAVMFQFIIHMSSVLVKDTSRLAITVSCFFGLAILYVNRRTVYAMFGLDDRNIVHWGNLFGDDSKAKGRVLQVSVWRVTAAAGTWEDIGDEDMSDSGTGKGGLWQMMSEA